MMYTDAIQAANSLVNIVPLLGGNASRKDYEDALTLVEYLVETSQIIRWWSMLVAKIAQYEETRRKSSQSSTTVLQRYQVAWPCCVS